MRNYTGILLSNVDMFCSYCFYLGFQLDVAKFFIFFLTLFLTSFAASAIAFWVSAGVKVAGIGNLLTALCFVVQMVGS